MKAALSALLCLTLGTQAFAYSDSEALQRLGRHLSTLEDKAHKARVIGGITMLGLGAAGGVGFFVARDSTDPGTRNTTAPILGIAGGVFLITGTLALLMKGNDETLPQEFKAMPDSQPKAKIIAGEDMLRLLAKEAKRERMFAAGSGAVIGVAQIVLYAAESGTKNSFLLYNGAIIAGISTIQFFTQRPAEEEWDAYREWRGDGKISASLGVVPTLGVPTPALVFNF